MNGRLRRCRCASGAHVHMEYAPLRFSLRLASGRFLNTRDSTNVESGR
jgi:hypothetical protein